MGFVLTLFQITMQKGSISVVEGDLGIAATTTGNPEDKNE
jgi:hypothetical protein